MLKYKIPQIVTLIHKIPQIVTLTHVDPYIGTTHILMKKAPTIIDCRSFFRWTTKIRTWTNRTKTCCATITP